MKDVWDRVPVIVKAVLMGAAVALAGSIPWAVLVTGNMRYLPAIPWAVPVMAIYLWIFWKYVRGAGWPRSTAESRGALCRAHRVPANAWGPALMAGALGLAALVLLLKVMNRMVALPAQQNPDLSRLSAVSIAMMVIMSALVAGVAEESAFRGYMQGPIERRYGPVTAILITGTLFGFAHFTHPEVSLILMPYYITVAAIYGSLAYLTNSILPGLVLHTAGNILGTIDLLARGKSEWQTPAAPSPLIWVSGPDASFWLNLLGFLAVGGAACAAYASLAKICRQTSSGTAIPGPPIP